MADKSKIEWTEATWNPIRGCSRTSPGCQNCYAEVIANRFKGDGQPYEGLIARTGQWNGKINFVDHLLDQPLRWGKPRMIFVNSMSDLFHESVTDEEIDEVFSVMALASHHNYQVLTKRARRMYDYFRNDNWIDRVLRLAHEARTKYKVPLALDNLIHEGHFVGGLPNVWLGVSVENQETANERIPLLLQTPAAVRWISAEPLLGDIDLHKTHDISALDGNMEVLDWVVVGGESGSNARPMHPLWARSLRDQCVNAGVSFFFKQWGSWVPAEVQESHITVRGECSFHTKDFAFLSNDVQMAHVGKKAAGRTLDGRTWDQYPRVSP